MIRTLVCIAAAAAVLTVVAGCASSRDSDQGFFSRITPYRIEIVQGNVVTSEQVARLRPGMTRAQVRDVLGTPLVTDLFHADRWDYIFTLRRDGIEPQRRSVIVWFEGDSMRSVESPDLPSEREFVQALSRSPRSAEPRALELTEEQRKALPVPPAREAAPVTPVGPVRSYPPLDNS